MIVTAATFEAPSPRKKKTVLKLQAIFHDGPVGLEFMTDDPSEAENMREQLLTLDCVAEVLVFDEPDGLKCDQWRERSVLPGI